MTRLTGPSRNAADDLETLRGRCQFLFDQGTSDEAEQALRELIDHSPDDASAHHNLGTLLMRAGAMMRPYRSTTSRCAIARTTRRPISTWAMPSRTAAGLTRPRGRGIRARLSPSDPTARQELARLGRGAGACGSVMLR